MLQIGPNKAQYKVYTSMALKPLDDFNTTTNTTYLCEPFIIRIT